MTARILIIEDEEPLTLLLRYNLEAEGYSVESAVRGDEADLKLKENTPDLAVIDWMLPGLSGIELIRRLRARPETQQLPIIMLTARGEETERVRGLATGADDYIVKPFSVPELLARIRALLRRTKPERVAGVLSAGDIELDREKKRVARADRDVPLGPTEFRLLEFLLENPGRVFSREQLLDRVWGRDVYVDERTVDVHVGRLRKALNRGRATDPIRTVRGAGYALNDRFVKSPFMRAAAGERARVVTSHLLPIYARVDLAFERGEGAWLIATNGERYLDFTGGVAVNALGHAHPYLVDALIAQAHRLWHVSNLFRIPEAERLAERLCAATFADLVFFCNSGAEAMECAIKVARKYQFASGRPERYRIITFEGAFHGRTLATLAAGGLKKYLEGFGPAVPGFDQVPFGDFAAVKSAIGPETAAILIEPIQGEGGVRVVPTPFLRGLRELCDKHELLLVLDEVQTGIGRTGSFFAHQRYGVTPDVMGVAKALGGGFPVGACLTTAEAGKGMTTGTHGSTFGANPLAMAVGNAVLDLVLAPEFLEKVRRSAILFRQRLAETRDRHPGVISEVRGEGLLLGLVAACPNGELVEALRAEKLLAAAAGDNVVRMLPPLIIDEPEIAEAIHRIDGAAARIELNQCERVAAGAKP